MIYEFFMCLIFSVEVLINVFDLGRTSSGDWSLSHSEILPKPILRRIFSILIFTALAIWSGIAAFSGDVSHCCSCHHFQVKEASK